MVGVVGRGGEEIEISGPRVRASEVEWNALGVASSISRGCIRASHAYIGLRLKSLVKAAFHHKTSSDIIFFFEGTFQFDVTASHT